MVATTLIAGYGLRDGGPSPVFLEAFVMYLPCIVLAVPIRLFRTPETPGVPKARSRTLTGPPRAAP